METTARAAEGESRPTIGERWVKLLSRRRLHAVIVLLGVALGSASLSAGMALDDHLQTVAAQAHPALLGLERTPLSLYEWAPDAASARHLIDQGIMPWWSDPDFRLRFLRPLASLSVWLDRQLWPQTPWIMHAENLLWFAAFLSVVSAIYRRVATSSAIAALAFLGFAIDDARGTTIGWICHRNALMALSFGLGSVALHMRARLEGSRASSWLSPTLLALGFLCGEPTLSALGYLLAFALFLDPGQRRVRWLSLLPHALVVVLWRVAYDVLGYGTKHSASTPIPLPSRSTSCCSRCNASRACGSHSSSVYRPSFISSCAAWAPRSITRCCA